MIIVDTIAMDHFMIVE